MTQRYEISGKLVRQNYPQTELADTMKTISRTGRNGGESKAIALERRFVLEGEV